MLTLKAWRRVADPTSTCDAVEQTFATFGILLPQKIQEMAVGPDGN